MAKAMLVLKNEAGNILAVCTSTESCLLQGGILLENKVDMDRVYVHVCDVDTPSVYGFDYQGTRYTEWLSSPRAKEREPARCT